MIVPFDPNLTDLHHTLCPPGEGGYALGSDAVGRDVLLRTIAGGTESVLVSFVVVALSLSVGTAVGLLAGYLGGAVDAVLSKIVVMFQAFPSFVLAIAIAAVLGQGVQNMVIAIVAAYWTQFARLGRSLAVSLKTSNSVRAARVCGVGSVAIMVRYVLPIIAPPLLVMAALSIGDVVLTMAGLAFLGLGSAPPTNEWGAMMSEARAYNSIAPWGIMVPGVALFLTVTIFNLLGDTLRDALDVRAASAAVVAEGREEDGIDPERTVGEERRNHDTLDFEEGIARRAARSVLGDRLLGGLLRGLEGGRQRQGAPRWLDGLLLRRDA
jgi:peptide/nickel transport system permease protein/nickel transport system permease protein